MNVNLSSLTESSTTTKTNLPDTTESSEASESQGFFSKLSSLIAGEDKDIKSEQAVDVDSLDIESTTSEMLPQTQNFADGEESLDSLLDSELVDIDVSKKAISDPEGELEATEANTIAERIVADNDKILQRLDSSANVLISKDGKELPVDQLNSQQPDEVAVLNEEPVEVARHNSKDKTETLLVNDKSVNTAPMTLSTETLTYSEPLKETQPDEIVTRGELKWGGETAQLSKQPLDATKNVENKTLANVSDVEKEEILLSEQQESPIHTKVQINIPKEGSEKQISGKSIYEKTRSESFDELKEMPIDMADDGLLASIQMTENSGAKRDELVLKQENLASNQGMKRHYSSNVVNQATQQATIAQANTSQSLLQNSVQDSLNTGVLQPMVNPNPAMLSEKALLGAGITGRAIGNLGKLIEEKQQGSEANISSAHQAGQGSQQLSGSQVSLQRNDPVNSANLQLARDFAGEQVAEKVQMMMSKNLKNIDIRLDPPELGRLQIRMQVTGEGTSVHFTVSNPQARDAIEHTMPRLREMLAQQGVQLGESSVQQQAAGQQRGQYGDKAQGADVGQSANATLTGDDLETDVGLELNILGKRDGISYYA